MNTSATDTLSRAVFNLTPLTAVLGVQMLFVALVLGVVANPVLPGRVSSKGLS